MYGVWILNRLYVLYHWHMLPLRQSKRWDGTKSLWERFQMTFGFENAYDTSSDGIIPDRRHRKTENHNTCVHIALRAMTANKSLETMGICFQIIYHDITGDMTGSRLSCRKVDVSINNGYWRFCKYDTIRNEAAYSVSKSLIFFVYSKQINIDINWFMTNTILVSCDYGTCK